MARRASFNSPPFRVKTAVVDSAYDLANRLKSVGAQTYTWDNNGNLLNDGQYNYAYDKANRLIGATVPFAQGGTTFTYNGLGDRQKQTVCPVSGNCNPTVTTYTLDLNAGLTQVLVDLTTGPTSGNNTYLYGAGRIAQYAGTAPTYFHGDSLGSVRQLTNASKTLTLARTYQPYGTVLTTAGAGASSYGFTGEWTDATNLQYLRARYYAPSQGRFLTADSWAGNYRQPLTLNKWLYTNGNPANFTDPSGHCIFSGMDTAACIAAVLAPEVVIPVLVLALVAAYLLPPAIQALDDCISDFRLPPPGVTAPRVESPPKAVLIPAPAPSQNPKPDPKPKREPRCCTPVPTPTPTPDDDNECEPAKVTAWKTTLYPKPAKGNSADILYQIRVAGPTEYKAIGGGVDARADGIRDIDCMLLDAKYVGNPVRSPYVPDSELPADIRAMILVQESNLFRRYNAIINDPSTPVVGLEVITNEARSIPYWLALTSGVSGGRVVLVP